MRYGNQASAEQFVPRELIDYSPLTNELGLNAIAISADFQSWSHKGGRPIFVAASGPLVAKFAGRP